MRLILLVEFVVAVFRPSLSPSSLSDNCLRIFAASLVTGMRLSALATLKSKHVNVQTRWINQDPKEVDTKFRKHIRTYCLDLGAGLLVAIEEWAAWRSANGFYDIAPFFLPDRYVQANAIGLGYRSAKSENAECWKDDGQINAIIDEAGRSAGFNGFGVTSHDFRKVVHAFLARRGGMTIPEEVALQLNFGQTPHEIIRKNYAIIQDHEREETLDELCRRAISYRSELELYLLYERNEISEDDPDYRRARDIFERNGRRTGTF